MESLSRATLRELATSTFGSDPSQVAVLAAAVTRGPRSTGVAAPISGPLDAAARRAADARSLADAAASSGARR